MGINFRFMNMNRVSSAFWITNTADTEPSDKVIQAGKMCEYRKFQKYGLGLVESILTPNLMTTEGEIHLEFLLKSGLPRVSVN